MMLMNQKLPWLKYTTTISDQFQHGGICVTMLTAWTLISGGLTKPAFLSKNWRANHIENTVISLNDTEPYSLTCVEFVFTSWKRLWLDTNWVSGHQLNQPWQLDIGHP